MAFWPNSLVREVAERRAIFFIGAGLSKTAYQAFPSWSELLVTLSSKLKRRKDRDLVSKLVRQGSMLDAAQIIRDNVVRADTTEILRGVFQIRPIPHHSVYEDLLAIDPKIIVTTNYDELLEKNFEHYSGGTEAHSISRHNTDHLLNDLRSPIRSIIKMHGCITNPTQLVLDRSSYFALKREKQSFLHIVQAIMTIGTVIFIGYSISDPDIQLILENINVFSRSDNPHYALIERFEHSAVRDATTNSYNIHFLEYPMKEHHHVALYLSELKKEVSNLREARGIV